MARTANDGPSLQGLCHAADATFNMFNVNI
jgi:hypothetical protein